MREAADRRRRWMWGALAVVVVLAAAAVWWWRPRAPHVATAVAERTDLQETIFAAGTVRPVDRQIVMPTNLTAPIAKVDVHIGDRVKKGQILITLQNEAQAAALQAAKTNLAQAQETLNAALQQQSAAPPGFQGQFTGTVAQARSSVAQAQANLSQAQAAYDATLLRAQMDGTVVLINPSGVGSDGNPAPVLEVVGDAKQIVTQVSEVDAVHVKKGMAAEVTSEAFPGKTWRVSVQQVGLFATTDTGGGQVEVDLGVPADFPVPLGYQVDVHIISATHKGVVAIPYPALVQDGQGYAVYVVRDGRAERRPVQLGITTDTRVEVTKGLQAGDVVILNPPAGLASGSAVRT
ncbi:MAG: efflux RND transporter periplasmic adaptor subunit [Alicyclobacillus macrosporangiidus]|uniref:efflux RND transporter periplasmic adaptor subunit n=1 Tax=Alicyclobacillus macrosporangiidus TaxID=392015 RepID=UPI0026ED0669|nr:efflux RND transporter periplasmic adaptor subunit [Alicyclobacillus macrosporangiidus]MCL6600045.1 efflux RND transporter periplasmic adaptor subunit [Alicyclobacillus macrosporangiidus]